MAKVGEGCKLSYDCANGGKNGFILCMDRACTCNPLYGFTEESSCKQPTDTTTFCQMVSIFCLAAQVYMMWSTFRGIGNLLSNRGGTGSRVQPSSFSRVSTIEGTDEKTRRWEVAMTLLLIGTQVCVCTRLLQALAFSAGFQISADTSDLDFLSVWLVLNIQMEFLRDWAKRTKSGAALMQRLSKQVSLSKFLRCAYWLSMMSILVGSCAFTSPVQSEVALFSLRSIALSFPLIGLFITTRILSRVRHLHRLEGRNSIQARQLHCKAQNINALSMRMILIHIFFFVGTLMHQTSFVVLQHFTQRSSAWAVGGYLLKQVAAILSIHQCYQYLCRSHFNGRHLGPRPARRVQPHGALVLSSGQYPPRYGGGGPRRGGGRGPGGVAGGASLSATGGGGGAWHSSLPSTSGQGAAGPVGASAGGGGLPLRQGGGGGGGGAVVSAGRITSQYSADGFFRYLVLRPSTQRTQRSGTGLPSTKDNSCNGSANPHPEYPPPPALAAGGGGGASPPPWLGAAAAGRRGGAPAAAAAGRPEFLVSRMRGMLAPWRPREAAVAAATAASPAAPAPGGGGAERGERRR